MRCRSTHLRGGDFAGRLCRQVMCDRSRSRSGSLFARQRAFAIERQTYVDPGALADAAANVDFAAVQPHQSFDDRQTETGAAMTAVIGSARLKVRLADAGQIFFVDADAVVFDNEVYGAGFRVRADGDFTAAIGKADRIGEEIEQDLTERALVGDHFRQLAAAVIFPAPRPPRWPATPRGRSNRQ